MARRPKIGFVLGAGSARGWAHIGVLRRQFGRKPDQHAHLGLFVQIPCGLLDRIDRLLCVASEDQVIDGLAEHLVIGKPLRGSAV